MKPILIGMMMCLMALNSHAASFDCSSANSFIDTLICSDPTLSKLDEELLEAYKRSRKQSKDPRTVGEQHRQWLKNVRNKCRQVGCLVNAYHDQITILNSIPSDKPAIWQGKWYGDGESKNEASELEITAIDSKGFEFSLKTVKAGRIETLSGRTSFFKSTAIYQDVQSGCVIQFKSVKPSRSKVRYLSIETNNFCKNLIKNKIEFEGLYYQLKKKTKE